MATTRRQWLQAGLAAAILGLAARASGTVRAQTSIPNGVVVRDSAGQDWLILRGKRVAVPLYPAADADIAALPTDQQWAVLSVTDDGAMVAGSRPAWLDTQVAATIAAQPVLAPPVVSPPTMTTAAPTGGAAQLTTDVTFQGIAKDRKSFRALVTVTNPTASALADVRLRADGVDGSGVVLATRTEKLPVLPPGTSFYEVIGASASAQDAQIQAVQLAVEDPGKTTTRAGAVVYEPFAVTDVKVVKYDNTYDRGRLAYRATATITNGAHEVGRFGATISWVLRGSTGQIVAVSRDSYISNAPEMIAPGMSLRVDSGNLDVTDIAVSAEVQAYQTS